jgi:ParB-like chromosome segregation protein Spo0J
VKDAYEIIAAESAGGQRSVRDCMTFRSCWSKRPTAKRRAAIIENVQRSDSIRWKGGGYQRSQTSTNLSRGHRQDRRQSRSHVTNTLRLLKLSEPIKAYINASKIQPAPRMLIGALIRMMAREIVERAQRSSDRVLAKERRASRTNPSKSAQIADTVAPSTACRTRSVSPSRSITAARAARRPSRLDQLDEVCRIERLICCVVLRL